MIQHQKIHSKRKPPRERHNEMRLFPFSDLSEKLGFEQP
jgi:hypothetical protein